MRVSTVYPRGVGSIWRKERDAHRSPAYRLCIDLSCRDREEKLWICCCLSAEKNSSEAAIWGGCGVWWRAAERLLYGLQISSLFMHSDSYVAEISIRWTKRLLCLCVLTRLLMLSVEGNHMLCDASAGHADCCALIKLISDSLQQKKTEDMIRMMSVSQQDKPINLVWEVLKVTDWWLTISNKTISLTQLCPSMVGNHELKTSDKSTAKWPILNH